MRIRRFLHESQPRLGVEVAARYLAPLAESLTSLEDLLANSQQLRLACMLAEGCSAPSIGIPIQAVQQLPPTERPGKIVCVGRNYRAHADEEGEALPSSVLIFGKFATSIIGPDQEIAWRASATSQVDYEAELAVIIGRTARHVSASHALDYAFGFTCMNDVSARDLQFADGQWTRGKSLDTFAPLGPVIVTTDEIGDPQDLRIACHVNGETVQDAHTSLMVFSVAEIIAYCSESFTLEPGDVIATGTPGGVGVFRSPPRFLADGDEVIVSIERIGDLRNYCRVS